MKPNCLFFVLCFCFAVALDCQAIVTYPSGVDSGNIAEYRAEQNFALAGKTNVTEAVMAAEIAQVKLDMARENAGNSQSSRKPVDVQQVLRQKALEKKAADLKLWNWVGSCLAFAVAVLAAALLIKVHRDITTGKPRQDVLAH